MCVLHTLVFLCGPALGRVLNILPDCIHSVQCQWLSQGCSEAQRSLLHIEITLLASSQGLQIIWDAVKERNDQEWDYWGHQQRTSCLNRSTMASC